MAVEDEEKAKEILLDIGYYRLGFYWFPFEETYPSLRERSHKFKHEASFKETVDLYYLDTEIRNLIAPYIYRIEVNFRTFLIYTVSNYYEHKPTWFADSKIVNNKFLGVLQNSYQNIKNNVAIANHHKKYPNDIYAPAWKTLEYMTFGDILLLAQNLKDKTLQQHLADHYGIRNTKILWSWLCTIRVIRNLCAHGHNLYDLRLQKSLNAGFLKSKMPQCMRHDMRGVLIVVFYFLEHISAKRAEELKAKLRRILEEPRANAVNGAMKYLLDVLK